MNPTTFNKPVKPTGTLADLTDEQREQLCEWLNSTKTYKEIKGLVETDLGVRLNSTSPLKEFRKRVCVPYLRGRTFCPPQIPREVWEFSIGEMVKKLQDPDIPIEIRVRIGSFLLQLSRLTLEYNKMNDKSRTPKKPKYAEASKPTEENPLDDQEKLDEVRRQVFGSAPE